MICSYCEFAEHALYTESTTGTRMVILQEEVTITQKDLAMQVPGFSSAYHCKWQNSSLWDKIVTSSEHFLLTGPLVANLAPLLDTGQAFEL